MSETLSIVGAGRVGKSLGRRLRELGWNIGVVVTRSIPTARAAVRSIGSGTASDKPTRQILGSKFVLITVPDREIANVAVDLARLGGHEWRGKIVLHTSGALDASILKPLSAAGAATGSIHPMQTFTSQSMPALAGCVFGIDGNPAAMKAARIMARQLGGVSVRLSGTNKAVYHAAGTLACTHVLTLVETATLLLMAQGFTRKQATRALLGLTRQTLDNLERLGPRGSWTGPLTRRDYNTVQGHVAALSDYSAEYEDAYKSMSRLTATVLSHESNEILRNLEAIFSAPQGASSKRAVPKKKRKSSACR